MYSFGRTRTGVALAVAAALGAIQPAKADVITLSWSGFFTMLTSGGAVVINQGSSFLANAYNGKRSEISGTMTYDTSTSTWTLTNVPFDFFGTGAGYQAVSHDFSMVGIGDGFGGPGTLALGNAILDWNLYNQDIPVAIVMDVSGFLAAIGDGYGVGEVITGGALPATNGINFGTNKKPASFPIGPAPFATTTWNATPTCATGVGCLGVNPSGVLPLIADAVGGTPIFAGGFTGYNPNFDITSLTVTGIVLSAPSSVPVPGTLWLMTTGLLAMTGLTRRRVSWTASQMSD